ncbi:hypothetical protein QVD17_09191 [Tagetes erecta]|uniref:Uncharacterized protein n=1 Tax=Tagetes erecta TaxID=13708 RepID=A0AAD8L3V7_TARER|nr:hypothetical protein QVD17_09191 [Tagetes erecta]
MEKLSVRKKEDLQDKPGVEIGEVSSKVLWRLVMVGPSRRDEGKHTLHDEVKHEEDAGLTVDEADVPTEDDVLFDCDGDVVGVKGDERCNEAVMNAVHKIIDKIEMKAVMNVAHRIVDKIAEEDSKKLLVRRDFRNMRRLLNPTANGLDETPLREGGKRCVETEILPGCSTLRTSRGMVSEYVILETKHVINTLGVSYLTGFQWPSAKYIKRICFQWHLVAL